MVGIKELYAKVILGAKFNNGCEATPDDAKNAD
jgi:hypothetical protein